ncbi:MAG: SUMF1/EgtB/PvdO family nonheme iron enzyme [Caulobacterales bacterium]
MTTEAAERPVRLASIVAIDVVGFSTMSEKDQRKAAKHIEALRHRIETVVMRNEGRIFNTAGDGFMLEFTSAGAAVNAINELLDQRPKGEPAIRLGAHVGDVVVTIGNDLLGHGVNVAARLQSLAEPNTALVSGEFRSMARTSPTAAFKSKGRQPLDNMNHKVETFAILSSKQKFLRNMATAAWCLLAAIIITGGVIIAPRVAPIAKNLQALIQKPVQLASAPATVPAPEPVAEETKPTAQLTASENTAPPPPQPGQTITDCPSCPEMMVIPAGTFEMGSPAKEIGRFADEGPQREVTVPSIAIGKYEVTFAQWDACLAGGGCKEFSPSDNSWGRGRRPVMGISRADAQSYVDWLNLQVGRPVYRLPTEAEWEYAARAGAKTAYSFGDKISRAEANFGAQRSDPVGSYAANAFGLYDMHGNVFEWTADCYADSYKGAAADGSAVAAPACKTFVYRGGSYGDKAGTLRAANRRKGADDLRNATIGIRVARNLN